MEYWWANPGQAVECIKAFEFDSTQGGFEPIVDGRYTIAFAGDACAGLAEYILGKKEFCLGLKEDPDRNDHGWPADHFRPIYPQTVDRMIEEVLANDQIEKAPRQIEKLPEKV